MHALTALIPLAALALLLAGSHRAWRHARERGRNLPRGSAAWLAVPVVALVGVTALCAAGLYRGGAAEAVVFALAALVSGAAALGRDRAREAADRLAGRLPLGPGRTRALARAAAVVACVLLAHLALEVPYNWLAAYIAPQYALIQCALILGLLLTLHLLFQRTGAGLVIGVALC